MKKIILGIFLGFMLHKGIQGYYNYSWWTAELQCREDVRNKEDPFVCIYDTMGYKKYIAYLIVSPDYSWQEWKLRN